MEYLTKEQKQTLRKIKTVPLAVKAVVYGGNKGGPAMAMQFNRDVKFDGLYGALLSVESYEQEGYYKPGTADKATTAALETNVADGAESGA